MDNEKNRIVNWNAGNEFNNIIHNWTEQYNIAHIERMWDVAIDILDNIFNFTLTKIAQQSDNDKEVIKKSEEINKKIANTMELIDKYGGKTSYQYIIRKRLRLIRNDIWSLQGKYGILYPFEEKKIKRDPGNAVSDFA